MTKMVPLPQQFGSTMVKPVPRLKEKPKRLKEPINKPNYYWEMQWTKSVQTPFVTEAPKHTGNINMAERRLDHETYT